MSSSTTSGAENRPGEVRRIGHGGRGRRLESASEASGIQPTAYVILRSTMDSLKALVAEKRKSIDNDSARPAKYMRRGDLERIKEEQEAKVREEQQLVQEAKKREESEKAPKKVSLVHILSLVQTLMLIWRAAICAYSLS